MCTIKRGCGVASVQCLVVAAMVLAVSTRALKAAEFFVATDGRDSNAGTIQSPFASIQRAQKAASPGDTVYIRGGTYKIREDQIARHNGIFAYVFDMDKSGTEREHINYFSYRDEHPIFDFSAVRPTGQRVIAFFVSGSWIHFKGLEIVGVQVTIKTHTQSECFENRGSGNIYEMLSMHDGMAIGIYLLSGSNNLMLNCDAYRNYDNYSEDLRGGNTDGFGCHPSKGSTGNVIRGCRSWFNSDDGYDCINAAESVTFENCWSFYNGFSTKFASLGDGNGFKAGGYGSTPAARLPNPIPRHVVRFCLAVHNKASGFYANHHVGGADWFNNTAYENSVNFNMLNRLTDNLTDIPGKGQMMRNNLGFKGRKEVSNLDNAHSDVANNYFSLNIPVNAADFVSLDEKQLVEPRQANGDLPNMTFMHLADGSPLIDRGVNVGFPFKGANPDLGCFEK